VTNNTACFVTNYTVDGPNPGYIPVTLPGTNTLIAAATANGDYTARDVWLAANPLARQPAA
jgi:hypothetical protein